jgi:hypothetical protein
MARKTVIRRANKNEIFKNAKDKELVAFLFAE